MFVVRQSVNGIPLVNLGGKLCHWAQIAGRGLTGQEQGNTSCDVFTSLDKLLPLDLANRLTSKNSEIEALQDVVMSLLVFPPENCV